MERGEDNGSYNEDTIMNSKKNDVDGMECQETETIAVVVQQQAEGVGKRTQDKLRAQGNYKHKTRAR